MDADALVLESGWSEFTGGWGEEDHDFYVPPVRVKKNNKKCTKDRTKSIEKKHASPPPLNPKRDPTAMLIKYAPQFSPVSGSSSRHIRPWTRGQDDIIHRGAKLAEAAMRKSHNKIDIDGTITSFFKANDELRRRASEKSSFVFISSAKRIADNGPSESGQKKTGETAASCQAEPMTVITSEETKETAIDRNTEIQRPPVQDSARLKRENKIDTLTPPRRSSKVKHLLEKIEKTTKVTSESSPPQVMVARVVSAGMHDGDSAKIYINNVNHSLNARGFNVVIVKPLTLEVSDVQSFNTHDNDAASLKMARYIQNLPLGVIVLIAVRTDATAHVCGECIRALQLLGARSFRPGFGGSWAFCGIKGEPRNIQRSTSRFQGPATIVQSFTSIRSKQYGGHSWLPSAEAAHLDGLDNGGQSVSYIPEYRGKPASNAQLPLMEISGTNMKSAHKAQSAPFASKKPKRKRPNYTTSSASSQKIYDDLNMSESKECTKRSALDAIAAALSERKAMFPSTIGKCRDGRGKGIVLKGSRMESKSESGTESGSALSKRSRYGKHHKSRVKTFNNRSGSFGSYRKKIEKQYRSMPSLLNGEPASKSTANNGKERSELFPSLVKPNRSASISAASNTNKGRGKLRLRQHPSQTVIAAARASHGMAKHIR
jgi:hypothetical protein